MGNWIPGSGAKASLPLQNQLISIIITTFNRGDVLPRALASLAQVETAGEFAREIVVVDNASTDDTRAKIEAFAATVDFPVRYAYEPQKGLPFARNRGLAEAQGDWLCFFDDDQLAERDWLLVLLREARRRNIKCVGGSRDLMLEMPEPPVLHHYCRELLGEAFGGHQFQPYTRKFLPTTGNVLIHRSVFDQLGGFDNTWLEGGEDTNFFNRLVRSGTEAWFTPNALVHHLITPNRVEPEYLERTALRSGVTMGRRDFEELSKPRLLLALAARWGHALVKFVPPRLWGLLSGNAPLAVAAKCRLKRVEGYTRLVLSRLLPGLGNQDRFIETLLHRGSRVATSAESAPSRALREEVVR